MAKFTMNTPTMSSGHTENPSELAEVRIFHHNALGVLGPDYLIRKWLPYKGPAFVCLILAMRKHIFYDYSTGEQRTRYFPEVATIAKLTGISERTVYRLLNDREMQFFIKRINRRRYSAEQQKEVQTSNLYLVSMDDPPTPEDVHLVEEEQRRIDAIERGEDPDAPQRSRSTARKNSDCQNGSLRGLPKWQSQSSANLADEDRITINNFDGQDTSIIKSEISRRVTIGNGQTSTTDSAETRVSANQTDQIVKQVRSAEQKDRNVKINIDQDHAADQIADRTYEAAPRNRELGQIIQEAPVLSEAEHWKSEAHGWLNATRLPARIGQPQGETIIEHHMHQFQVENTAAAQEMILNHAAPILAKYHIPVETLEQLAEQARRRTTMYVHKINADGSPATTNPGGYFLNVLRSVISEYGKTRDLVKLDRKTAKMEVTDAAAANHRMPATRAAARKANGQTLADAFNQQRSERSRVSTRV